MLRKEWVVRDNVFNDETVVTRINGVQDVQNPVGIQESSLRVQALRIAIKGSRSIKFIEKREQLTSSSRGHPLQPVR